MKRENMYILYSALIITHVINIFLELNTLSYLVGILAILSLVFSFRDATLLFKIIGTIFLITGSSLFFYSGVAWYQIPYLMTSTTELLALLFVLPFINSIIVVGRYDQNINKLLKGQVSHLGLLYYRSVLTTYLLGSFLNFATIPLVQSVLYQNLKHKAKKIRDVFISQTVLRGFAMCLAWSPMEILVAITVDITGVSYLSYLPWLIFFSFSFLVFESVLGLRYRKHALYEPEAETEVIDRQNSSPNAPESLQNAQEKDFSQTESNPIDSPATNSNPPGVDGAVLRKIGALLIGLCLFVTSIITVGNLLDVSFLMAVTLVVIPFSLLWAVLIKKWHTYLIYSIHAWKARTNSLQNFVVLFTSLGYFVSILRETVLLDYLQQPFAYVADTPILVLIGIQLLFLIMALLGVHPLATIGVLGEVLQPLLTMVNPLSIGIVLVTSGLATITVGPYNMTVTMIAHMNHQNPYQITWYNLLFAVSYGGWGILIAFFLL